MLVKDFRVTMGFQVIYHIPPHVPAQVQRGPFFPKLSIDLQEVNALLEIPTVKSEVRYSSQPPPVSSFITSGSPAILVCFPMVHCCVALRAQ